MVRHRALVALFARDPGVTRALADSWSDIYGGRMLELFAGPEADESRAIAAHAAIVGIALTGGAPQFAALPDDTLRAHLVEVVAVAGAASPGDVSPELSVAGGRPR